MGSGAKVSVTGGGIDAKAAVVDPGSGANSAPPVLMACSDTLHKGMAVVISVGAGTGMVVVVVGTDAVQVMRDAGLFLLLLRFLCLLLMWMKPLQGKTTSGASTNPCRFPESWKIYATGFSSPYQRVPHSPAGTDLVHQVALLVVEKIEAIILHSCTKKG